MAKGTRDYAKKTTVAKRRRSTKKPNSLKVVRLSLVTLILIAGFASGLLYLNHLYPTIADKPRTVAATHEQITPPKTHKPRFEFYTILPNKDTGAAPNAATRTTSNTKQYVLQIAAFKSQSDADRLRAELILLGFNANIQQVSAQGATWNRVSLGPYASLVKAEHDQNKLRGRYKSILRQVN